MSQKALSKKRAHHALDAYKQANDYDPENVFRDLIADLLHVIGDETALDPQEELKWAYEHFLIEQKETMS